jgi:hypothetical protein
MSIIWNNSTLSGLCDRLNDILILSTFAKIKNKKLKLIWRTQHFNQNCEIAIKRPLFRREDYLLDNLNKYITLPENIIIYTEGTIIKSNNEDEIFSSYIGGVHSPITFFNTYNDKSIYKIEDFINTYYSQANNIKFRFDIDLNKYNKFISVHLRRTDKLVKNGAATHAIDIDKIDILDELTYNVIEKLINDGYTHFYFAGDDIYYINQYINKYNNRINIINSKLRDDSDEIKNTYLDLCIMSKSEYIILSQRHSSFSLLASMINKAKLIYLYNDDIIEHTDYKSLPNIIYYKNI